MSWRDAQGPFVFFPSWLEASDEASEDENLKERLGAQALQTIAEKGKHSFHYSSKLGGFFVLLRLFLALET